MQTARFDIKDLLPLGLTLVVFGIAVAYGLNVQEDVTDTLGAAECAERTDTYTSYDTATNNCENSTGSEVAVGTAQFNASTDGVTAVAKLPAKLPLIVTVIVAALVIGILVRYLFVKLR